MIVVDKVLHIGLQQGKYFSENILQWSISKNKYSIVINKKKTYLFSPTKSSTKILQGKFFQKIFFQNLNCDNGEIDYFEKHILAT